MSEWWQFWNWIPSPLDDYEPNPTYTVPNIEHPPIKTRKGRVVYNRKLHNWSQADRDRILFNFYHLEGKEKAANWVTLLEKLTIDLLQIIFMRFYPGGALTDVLVQRLYYVVRDALATILDHMGDDLRASADAELHDTYGL